MTATYRNPLVTVDLIIEIDGGILKDYFSYRDGTLHRRYDLPRG